jgi:hypothetical protein
MAGDVVAGLDDLGDRLRIQLGALAVDPEGGADAVFAKQVDQPVDADLAAIAAPGDAGVIDHALLHRACLHGIGRRLALAPGLQHRGDAHRDPLAVRPLVLRDHGALPADAASHRRVVVLTGLAVDWLAGRSARSMRRRQSPGYQSAREGIAVR